MMNKDFAVFILTHGRPDNVITLNTLKKSGYTGKIYFIIDNEDKRSEEYYTAFGKERVIMFDKKKYADECDEGNNFDERRTITMARNACFDIAKQVGVKYFIQLDDDYTAFDYRIPTISKDHCGEIKPIKNIDVVFYLLLNFYKKNQFLSIAMAQGGDFIGGIIANGKAYRFSKRKCMNTFICSTERPFKFIGAMNEDVNTYTTLGSRGNLFLTIPFISITQKATQSQTGGITDMYKKYGTYCKAFTTVMMAPSSVFINMMAGRLHHKPKWNNIVPKIISEDLKKKV